MENKPLLSYFKTIFQNWCGGGRLVHNKYIKGIIK